ncbi:MAG: pilus assembly protein PilP [Rhodocyclaceae bacterium]|nr:pilus assembly protein PilP [Rhodocyclaceae bacterium]MCP5238125.1 pilus assembly protein PilP [Zoogloeaceae bacterium]
MRQLTKGNPTPPALRTGRPALSLIALLLMAACSSPQEDIQVWMDDQSRHMVGKVQQLPEIKPAEQVAYVGYDYPDPFRPAATAIDLDMSTSEFRPDLTRRREPLEAFALETLAFVGTLEMGSEKIALVMFQAPAGGGAAGQGDGTLYQIRKGNYMGQDFGLVAEINDTELTLKELVEDLNGEWGERVTTMELKDPLAEEASK